MFTRDTHVSRARVGYTFHVRHVRRLMSRARVGYRSDVRHVRRLMSRARVGYTFHVGYTFQNATCTGAFKASVSSGATFATLRCSRAPREKELQSPREHVSMLAWLV